jgi:hypothetical protein
MPSSMTIVCSAAASRISCRTRTMSPRPRAKAFPTVRCVICSMSCVPCPKNFGVEWEFSHAYDPVPIGYIRRGVCDLRLRQQLDAIANLADELPGLMDEESGNDEEDDGPAILKFPSRDQ